MSSSSTVNNESMDAIKKYSSFVEDTLKPQLKESLQKRDEITQELVEYKELEDLVFELIKQRQTHQANSQPHKLKTLMDLGQKFQVHAKIPDTSMIIIDIGLNFHVEMTLEEAKEFIIGHLKHLKSKQHKAQEKAKEISAHVNVVLEAIQQLATLQYAGQ